MVFHYVLAALLIAQGCLAHTKYRIVNGDESPPHQFPYLVSIVGVAPSTSSYRHMCGGTILDKDWVLTAAHCVMKAPETTKLGVYAGKHIINQREDGQRFSGIKFTVVHPKYPEGKGEHDIALLRLVTPLKYSSSIKSIKLPHKDKVHNGPVVLSGWGSISNESLPKYSAVLQTVTVPIVDNNLCSDALQEFPGDSQIFGTQLCTGPLHGSVSACLGDGGSPLIKYEDTGNDEELVGIVSWGIYPCGSGAPTVYTRVSSYVDWIKNILIQ